MTHYIETLMERYPDELQMPAMSPLDLPAMFKTQYFMMQQLPLCVILTDRCATRSKQPAECLVNINLTARTFFLPKQGSVEKYHLKSPLS